MLIDFATLKGYVHAVLADLDHRFINEIAFLSRRGRVPRNTSRCIFTSAYKPC